MNLYKLEYKYQNQDLRTGAILGPAEEDSATVSVLAIDAEDAIARAKVQLRIHEFDVPLPRKIDAKKAARKVVSVLWVHNRGEVDFGAPEF